MESTGRYGDEQSREDVQAWIDRCGTVGTVMVLRWCEHKRTDYFLTQLHALSKDEVTTLTPRICAFGRDGVMVATADTCARLLIPTAAPLAAATDGHQYGGETLRRHARVPSAQETALLELLRGQAADCC